MYESVSAFKEVTYIATRLRVGFPSVSHFNQVWILKAPRLTIRRLISVQWQRTLLALLQHRTGWNRSLAHSSYLSLRVIFTYGPRKSRLINAPTDKPIALFSANKI